MLKPNVCVRKKIFGDLQQGKSIGERYVVLFIRKTIWTTIGQLSASRKVENSVSRNRARRLMKRATERWEKFGKRL
jgi:ribonuclease P protein component